MSVLSSFGTHLWVASTLEVTLGEIERAPTPHMFRLWLVEVALKRIEQA
jgi:hypothetical protein